MYIRVMELLKKLNYKGSNGVWIIGAPVEFDPIQEEIRKVVPVKTALTDGEIVTFVLVFITSKAELEVIVRSITIHLDEQTILWFAYPKKSSKRYKADISRDIGWEPLGTLGYEPVRQVAIDADWSALRFRPVKHIKTLTRNASMVLSEEARHRLKEH